MTTSHEWDFRSCKNGKKCCYTVSCEKSCGPLCTFVQRNPTFWNLLKNGTKNTLQLANHGSETGKISQLFLRIRLKFGRLFIPRMLLNPLTALFGRWSRIEGLSRTMIQLLSWFIWLSITYQKNGPCQSIIGRKRWISLASCLRIGCWRSEISKIVYTK